MAGIFSVFMGAIPPFFDRFPFFSQKIHQDSGLQKDGKHGRLREYIGRVYE